MTLPTDHQKLIRIRHTCGHVYQYTAPPNDPNGDIATGMAMQKCAECAEREQKR